MVTLTPQERGELHGIIMTAFDRIGLKQLVWFNFPDSLDGIVNETAGMNEVVLKLLETTIQRGELEPLLRASLKARPNHPDIVAFCQKHVPNALTPANLDGLVHEVRSGLDAVAQTAAGIAAFSQAGEFRATFRSSERQMTIMAAFKGLHEELHDLQLHLGPIESAALQVGSTTPPSAALLLAREVVNLKSKAKRARRMVNDVPNKQPEIYWIEQLEEATADLDRAPRENDGERAAQGAVTLRQLLLESFRIEGLIVASAVEMQLGDLIRALTEIDRQIVRNSDDAKATAARVGKAAEALSVLRPQLAGMINEHSEWQLLSKELVGLEARPGFRPSQKIPRWTNSVRPRLQRLWESFQVEPWAQDVKTFVGSWESSAEEAQKTDASETVKAQQIYAASIAAVQLEATCMNRFVDADRELLELCGHLTKIGVSLRAVLEH